MIGDHHQLPPVIKNMAFQKYSNMEQSLFTRFVRLGVPTVDLDAQGRARARSASFSPIKRACDTAPSSSSLNIPMYLSSFVLSLNVNEMVLFVYCSLCNLYNWRYKQLGNLPHVQCQPEFQAPNPGFAYDFQLINVEDFNGIGESEPNPYFYQVSGGLHLNHTDFY